MLLNHADSGDFHQEGICVAIAAALDNPDRWSIPWPPNDTIRMERRPRQLTWC